MRCRVVALAAGARLWHSGILCPQIGLLIDEPLWVTLSDSGARRYDALARADAADDPEGPPAYRSELCVSHTVRLGWLAEESLRPVLLEQCGARPHRLKRALARWARSHGLDGAAGIEGDEHEVLVAEPEGCVWLVQSEGLAQPAAGAR